MKKIYIIFIVLIMAFTPLLGGCELSIGIPKNLNQTQNFENSLIDTSQITTYQNLVSTCKPAVVGIVSTFGRTQSVGSGVCVKKGNYVLTNYHVIDGGGNINLYLSDGTTATAQVVWADTSSDLAVLKSSKNIPYLPLAQSNSYQSGDEVIAIGTPINIAFKHSVTKGIISATNRTLSVDNDGGTSTLYNLIQHDASINPGNSGGPLISTSGEVIGINTLKVTDAEGLGFAIPVDTFLPAIEKISANGTFKTSYMGVFGYDNQLANIGSVANGFYVVNVADGSPAQKAGIKKGDVIVEINNIKIDLAKDLKSALYKFDVNDNIFVKYISDGNIKSTIVKLREHPYSFVKNI